ncbi:Na+/H+ antiporter subunit E [Luteimonas sp. e5]
MKRRLLPSIPQSLTVFLFWLLLVETIDAGNVLLALLLAWLLPLVAARLEREFARLGQLRHLPFLVLLLLWDVLRANFTVARQILGRTSTLRSDFIWVPLELTNIHGISALASLITLTPGTVSAELAPDRRHLLVHCLNVDDKQAMIREIKTRYEAPMLKVFP